MLYCSQGISILWSQATIKWNLVIEFPRIYFDSASNERGSAAASVIHGAITFDLPEADGK